jgi:CRISPR-associated endonuclease/helicase Cas3
MNRLALGAEASVRFADFFQAITNDRPFPWQEALFDRFLRSDLPQTVCLPTGAGKTSIMAIWLLALAEQARSGVSAITLPRRLVWVVNRRVVVDQATTEATALKSALRSQSQLEPVRDALRRLAPGDSLLGISTLRGQFADNAEWRSDPARPAVIVGTVDMIGSRLLFSGYGIGYKTKPLQAAFLAQDSLLVHDEAHLEPAFQNLITTIGQEQKRCRDFGRFHTMALSATLRGEAAAFGLTDAEKHVPEQIPNLPEKPIHYLWRRQAAPKRISLAPVDDEKDALRIAVTNCAENFKDRNCTVLIFLRSVENVKEVANRLAKKGLQSQTLTGTMRGLERDELPEDPVFKRFLPPKPAPDKTVYLVCTSAGEVGVNLSADHLICDLTTFESMVQRFGRVNRFGDNSDTEIHVFHPAAATLKSDDTIDECRERTLEQIKKLEGLNASPKALSSLDQVECSAAFSPLPTILAATDILFDAWSLTTIRHLLPARPHVEPYLHGVTAADPPETYVAWREEVGCVRGQLLEEYWAEDLLEDYPLKPHELLRDRSDRVFKELETLAGQKPDDPVWLVDDDDSVEATTLGKLTSLDAKEIRHKTVLLSPSTGGLNNGFLDGRHENKSEADVADQWYDETGRPRRLRLWSNDDLLDTKVKGMRLVRSINLGSDEADAEEDSEDVPSRWLWFERAKDGDTDGSRTATGAVLWNVHTRDVKDNISSILSRLSLPEDIHDALVRAADWHDLGKRRARFQTIIGNARYPEVLLAKSGAKNQAAKLDEDYRHEFGSLFDIRQEREFWHLSQDMRDLALHVIAAHHGRARPHFPPDEVFEPEPRGLDPHEIAAEVTQRFGRLQRKYGRWGLAYLESLLRAADYAASAKPSEVVEEP